MVWLNYYNNICKVLSLLNDDVVFQRKTTPRLYFGVFFGLESDALSLFDTLTLSQF